MTTTERTGPAPITTPARRIVRTAGTYARKPYDWWLYFDADGHMVDAHPGGGFPIQPVEHLVRIHVDARTRVTQREAQDMLDAATACLAAGRPDVVEDVLSAWQFSDERGDRWNTVPEILKFLAESAAEAEAEYDARMAQIAIEIAAEARA